MILFEIDSIGIFFFKVQIFLTTSKYLAIDIFISKHVLSRFYSPLHLPQRQKKRQPSICRYWLELYPHSPYDFIINHVCNLDWQVSPQKMLRIAFGIRALSSAYIQRVFIKTEMTLKSKSVSLSDSSRTLHRSKSSENLPSSQSQVNIQMMSRTLTIREVIFPLSRHLPIRYISIEKKKQTKRTLLLHCKYYLRFFLHNVCSFDKYLLTGKNSWK